MDEFAELTAKRKAFVAADRAEKQNYTADELLAVWAINVLDLDHVTKGEWEALGYVLRPWIQDNRDHLKNVYKTADVFNKDK